MRSSKNRSRGKNRNNNRNVGNVVNRVFDSSGPEGKVRGTPQQIIDKYQQMHRDAQLSGDRVSAENFQQHAEHYLRMLGEAMREQEARREQQEQQQRERQQQQQERREQNQQRHDEAHAEVAGHGDVEAGDQPKPKKKSRSRSKSGGDDVAAEDRSGLERALGAEGGSDVIDLSDEGDNGLVETVESKPKSRSRKPKAAPETDEQPAAE